MINSAKTFAIALAFTTGVLSGCSSQQTQTGGSDAEWTPLLDNTLSQWEVWMGVPHDTVKGLPEGTHTSDNLNQHGDTSKAMGLNRDVKNVFQISEENGKPLLHISGEIYGGLTTLRSYSNYHLQLQVKWGEKKWAPRLAKKRDSGLLFHCSGPHGAFWRVWKACQELQIQEADFGDYIPLAGPSAVIRARYKDGKHPTFDPNSNIYEKVKGYSNAYIEPDLPNGEWNTVDLYALNDIAFFVVNGETVMVIEESKSKDGSPLTQGQLQLQSEGAELYYRDIKIKPISKIPTKIIGDYRFKPKS